MGRPIVCDDPNTRVCWERAARESNGFFGHYFIGFGEASPNERAAMVAAPASVVLGAGAAMLSAPILAVLPAALAIGCGGDITIIKPHQVDIVYGDSVSDLGTSETSYDLLVDNSKADACIPFRSEGSVFIPFAGDDPSKICRPIDLDVSRAMSNTLLVLCDRPTPGVVECSYDGSGRLECAPSAYPLPATNGVYNLNPVSLTESAGYYIVVSCMTDEDLSSCSKMDYDSCVPCRTVLIDKDDGTIQQYGFELTKGARIAFIEAMPDDDRVVVADEKGAVVVADIVAGSGLRLVASGSFSGAVGIGLVGGDMIILGGGDLFAIKGLQDGKVCFSRAEVPWGDFRSDSELAVLESGWVCDKTLSREGVFGYFDSSAGKFGFISTPESMPCNHVPSSTATASTCAVAHDKELDLKSGVTRVVSSIDGDGLAFVTSDGLLVTWLKGGEIRHQRILGSSDTDVIPVSIQAMAMGGGFVFISPARGSIDACGTPLPSIIVK